MKLRMLRRAFLLGGICIILIAAFLPLPVMWKAAGVICGVVSVLMWKVMEE